MLKADVLRVQQLAEKRGALNIMLQALDRRIKLLETQAKLTGALSEPGAARNELHVHFSDETALRVAQVYLARHKPAELPETIDALGRAPNERP
jgi:hypothetical protein